MRKSDLTLDAVKKSPKLTQGKVYRASDFLTDEEIAEHKAAVFNRKNKKRRFDEIDAMVAEIIARFGWKVYQKWNAGEIPNDKIVRWCYAERAREKQRLLNLEGLILNTGIISSVKKPSQPHKIAVKILKDEEKIARGDK